MISRCKMLEIGHLPLPLSILLWLVGAVPHPLLVVVAAAECCLELK